MIISLFPHERCCCCLNVFIRDTHLFQLFLKDGQDHDWFLQDFVASAVISSLGSHCETSQGARPAKTVITLLTCCDTVFEH